MSVLLHEQSERHGWPLNVVEDAGDDPPVERPREFLDALRRALVSTWSHSTALEELDGLVGGRLLRSGDPGWDDAVQTWNGMVAKTPLVVVQPASAADVAAAVTFARRHIVPLGVKGGGHNIAGTAIVEGGLLLDMSLMRDVVVDPERRLVHAGPGCRLSDVDRATQQHGLATVLGFVSKVGIAGLTLGGGLGYLTRRFGWTVDNLEEVEIVTADGLVRIASGEQHTDLFWALCGGGGNFGVVTRFTLRLHEVGPQVYGGLIAWPFEQAARVATAYRELTHHAPRELSVWLIMLHAPPAPFVPSEWHGRRVCAMAVCYSGDLDEVEQVLAPLRGLGEPVFDLLHTQPYTQLQSYLDDTEPDGAHYYWKTDYVIELTDELLACVRELAGECPIPDGQIGLLQLGGALNERTEDDGAVGNRDVQFAIGVNGMWEPDEPRADEFRRWVQAASQQLRPHVAGRSYINFQTVDEGADRIQASYGANYGRLAAVKRTYNPDNLFRANRNIPPA